MSFFSNFFKCCESTQVLQNELKSEISIVRTDQKNITCSFNDNKQSIFPNSPKISQASKVRSPQKELSFFNLEVMNAVKSPRKKDMKLNLQELENNENINNVKGRLNNKELSFLNLEVVNTANSPKKQSVWKVKPEENVDDADLISLTNENLNNQSPQTKKKKDKIKMELKYATLGEFEINNIEKQIGDDEDNSPRFTEIKKMKSILNEEDCDIALLKKPFKKFQTTQDGDKKNKRNSEKKENNNQKIEEIINFKKQIKELKDNAHDGTTTPLFTNKKPEKFQF